MRRTAILLPVLLAACEPISDQETSSSSSTSTPTSTTPTGITTGTETETTDTVNGMPAVCSVIPDDGPGACFAENSPIPFKMMGPNVQLVVDRSGSMQGSKWAELQMLTAFLPEVGKRANLGLSLFSSPHGEDHCSVGGSMVVPLDGAPDAATDVSNWLLNTSPGGSTPIAGALSMLVGEPSLQCPNRDNIVVLLTDGDESCGGTPEIEVERLTSQPEPVELYVIGFGTGASTNSALQSIADAARDTTPGENFYTASTVEELVGRLAAVTATCTAQIDIDFDPDLLQVSLDGVALAECTEDRCEGGYTIDEEFGHVRIEGMDCLALPDGECHDLQFSEAP